MSPDRLINYWPILIIVIFIICSSRTAYSQDQIYLDSLKNEIDNQPQSREKVDNLILVSMEFYRNYQMDSADNYTQKAIMISEKINYEDGKAEALYRQSLIFFRTGDFNTSIRKVNLFLDLAELLQDSVKLGKGYWLRGTLSRETNELNNAKNDYRASLSIFQSTYDTSRMLSIFQSMGNLFFHLAEYDSAAFYYHKTLEFCESIGNEKGMSSALNQLAKTYLRLPIPQYQLAEQYLQKSITINKKYNNLRELAISYNALANIALNKEELDTAIYYYEKGKEINREIDDKTALAHYYNNIAKVYEKQERYDKALANYQKAMLYYRNQKIDEGKIVVWRNIADIYCEREQFNYAHAYYDSSLVLANRTGYKERQQEVLKQKTLAYYKEGEYKEAFDLHSRYDELTDSIFNIEKAEIIANLKLKYEREKDQAQIFALEKENLEKDLQIRIRTNQRNTYLYTGIGIVSLILFVAIYFRLNAIKDRIISEQKIRQLEDEKKMLAAKSLVEGQEEERKRVAKELHDGLGVLLSAAKIQFSSIKDESSKNQELIEKASNLIDQATSDVRKISHNMMPGLLTKFGLFEAVDDMIEKLGDTEVLKVSCRIEGEKRRLPENIEIMLYRILQELVNNTLKHAKANNIQLAIKILGDKLEITYSDDGIGFNVNENVESKSIGLQSIHSRINFLNGQLTIDSDPGLGAKFEISVPLT